MKVLIVDDEKPARDRLARMINELAEYEVVGQAKNGCVRAPTISADPKPVEFSGIVVREARPGWLTLDVPPFDPVSCVNPVVHCGLHDCRCCFSLLPFL